MKINPKTGKPLTEADIMVFNPGDAPAPESDEPELDAETPSDGAEKSDEGEASEPAEEQPPKEATPRVVELVLDGKTHSVPPEVAEAYRAEINRRDGKRGNELQRLREELEQVKSKLPKPEPEAPKPEGPRMPDPALQITDPEEYQRQLVSYTEARVRVEISAAEERAKAEMARQSEEERRQTEWVSYVEGFYKENPELNEARDVVDAVWQKHKNTWAQQGLSVEDAFKELGPLTKQRLTELARGGKAVAAPRNKPPALENSRSKVAVSKPSGEDNEPGTITAFLKQRRDARNAAFERGGVGKAAVGAH